ncbi:hypothetical protein C8R44DRAFT_740584 [Mycena epipterygia]|nr:hypothetical protein C8R44DRAFT_740584 [Mycena epipterygia]
MNTGKNERKQSNIWCMEQDSPHGKMDGGVPEKEQGDRARRQGDGGEKKGLLCEAAPHQVVVASSSTALSGRWSAERSIQAGQIGASAAEGRAGWPVTEDIEDAWRELQPSPQHWQRRRTRKRNDEIDSGLSERTDEELGDFKTRDTTIHSKAQREP